MKKDLCHLCGGALFDQPVIKLDGVPSAAQHYPTEAEFALDRGITLMVRQCRVCGLVQLNAPPVDYYREVITAASLSGVARKSRLLEMRTFAAEHGLAGRKVLEIGCGRGDMLEVMAEAGMVPTGLEGSRQSVEYGRGLGRTMIAGYLVEMEAMEGAPFDAFFCLNYLEHMPDPGEVIRKIADFTTDVAVGFVTVPNLAHLLRSKCHYEFVADHLSYFTAESLTFAFRSKGFDVLSCDFINNDNDILCITRKTRLVDLSDACDELEALKVDLRRIIARYRSEGKRVAVWGGGHRTLALLALAGVDELDCVVDSAPFKQGRFTPVLHKPIYHPDYLKSGPFGLVLVMVPGIYPDEVLKAIAAMGIPCDVAVLRGNRIVFLGNGRNAMGEGR